MDVSVARSKQICIEWMEATVLFPVVPVHKVVRMMRMLMDARADVNAQGGACGNALQAASFRGHDKVIRMLLVV
jgi:hypothetical protein